MLQMPLTSKINSLEPEHTKREFSTVKTAATGRSSYLSQDYSSPERSLKEPSQLAGVLATKHGQQANQAAKKLLFLEKGND